MFGADTECPARFLLLLPQSSVVQGCHHGLPHPLAQRCPHREEQDCEAQQQNWHSCVEMAVGCGFTVCKYMTVRTVSLNEAVLSVVDLYMYCDAYFYSCFLLLSVNKMH